LTGGRLSAVDMALGLISGKEVSRPGGGQGKD